MVVRVESNKSSDSSWDLLSEREGRIQCKAARPREELQGGGCRLRVEGWEGKSVLVLSPASCVCSRKPAPASASASSASGLGL